MGVISECYQNLYTVSILFILMHGVISIPDATSYDMKRVQKIWPLTKFMLVKLHD